MNSGRLKPLGFFCELRHGLPNGPSLRNAARGDRRTEEEDKIVSYLERGNVLSITGVNTYDVLQESKKCIGQLYVATDGVWMWPSDLPYYVATYHIEVPSEFVLQARARQWTPPQYSDDELGAIWEDHLASKAVERHGDHIKS